MDVGDVARPLESNVREELDEEEQAPDQASRPAPDRISRAAIANLLNRRRQQAAASTSAGAAQQTHRQNGEIPASGQSGGQAQIEARQPTPQPELPDLGGLPDLEDKPVEAEHGEAAGPIAGPAPPATPVQGNPPASQPESALSDYNEADIIPAPAQAAPAVLIPAQQLTQAEVERMDLVLRSSPGLHADLRACKSPATGKDLLRKFQELVRALLYVAKIETQGHDARNLNRSAIRESIRQFFNWSLAPTHLAKAARYTPNPLSFVQTIRRIYQLQHDMTSEQNPPLGVFGETRLLTRITGIIDGAIVALGG